MLVNQLKHQKERTKKKKLLFKKKISNIIGKLHSQLLSVIFWTCFKSSYSRKVSFIKKNIFGIQRISTNIQTIKESRKPISGSSANCAKTRDQSQQGIGRPTFRSSHYLLLMSLSFTNTWKRDIKHMSPFLLIILIKASKSVIVLLLFRKLKFSSITNRKQSDSRLAKTLKVKFGKDSILVINN